MNRLAKLCGRLIGGHRGFSIGIDDVMPSEVLLDLKVRALVGFVDGTQKDGHEGGGMARPGAFTRQNKQNHTNHKRTQHELLGAGFRKCDEQIALYESGKLPLKPGCNPLQSLESELNSVLGTSARSLQHFEIALPHASQGL